MKLSPAIQKLTDAAERERKRNGNGKRKGSPRKARKPWQPWRDLLDAYRAAISEMEKLLRQFPDAAHPGGPWGRRPDYERAGKLLDPVIARLRALKGPGPKVALPHVRATWRHARELALRELGYYRDPGQTQWVHGTGTYAVRQMYHELPTVEAYTRDEQGRTPA